MQYIGSARNTNDVEQALTLATRIFREDEPFQTALATTRFLMSAGKDLCLKDVMVLEDKNNQIVGTCFLIDRLFFKGAQTIKGTFLSSICIAQNHRGRGFSEILMNSSIAECERRDSAFAILIARRAVDHFYTKFNFWGLSQYSKINVTLNEKPQVSGLDILSATTDDLPRINCLYESNYCSLLGSCVRSTDQWKHILLKSRKQNLEFVTLKKDTALLGYAILNRTEIEELASSSNTSMLELLRNLVATYSLKNLAINCSPMHPVVLELTPFDFSITLRQCIYGGHMIRIINARALSKVKSFERNSQASADHSQNISVSVDGGATDAHSQRHAQNYENTCELMGASILSTRDYFGSAPLLRSFNVSIVDQV